jgi:hypothetical protein
MNRMGVTQGLLLAVGAGVVAISGCVHTRGPQLVLNSHLEYNKAVSQVLKEELLLNVVRRRYLEPLQFVAVSSISTNIGLSVDASAGGTFDNSSGSTTTGVDIGIVSGSRSGSGSGIDLTSVGVNGSVSFSDSPTVTITPRQGEDIAKQLQEPLAVSAVADLIAAGYPIDGVAQLLVQGINDLRGPMLQYDKFRPGNPEWREMITLIKKFSEDGSLIISRFRWNDPYTDYSFPAEEITPEMWITTLSTGARRWKSYDGGKTFMFTTHEMAPAVWLDEDVRNSPEGTRLMELLNVQPDVQKKIWYMEPARVVEGPDLENAPVARRPTLKLRMRSLYNVISLYSYIVDVPPEDEAQGRATDLTTFRESAARGEVDNFPEKSRIRWSRKRPPSAFLAIHHRGLWFYIDDGDRNTKVIFNALYDLWQLSMKGPSSEATPVTTIQVN